jgi:hypothetical protein
MVDAPLIDQPGRLLVLREHPHFPTPTFRHRLSHRADQRPEAWPALPLDRGAPRAIRVASPVSLALGVGLAGCAAAAMRLLA